MSARFRPVLLVLALWLLLAGCSAESLLDPPRLATQTARAERATTLAATPLLTAPPAAQGVPVIPTPVPTPLRMVATVNRPITVWVDETSPAHIEVARALGDQFAAATDTPVRFVFVDRDKIAGLARTAALTGQLPDVILHSIAFTAGLAEQGILDPAAAEAVVARLGRETFLPGVLELVQSADNRPAALPLEGWQHLLLYRSDWFEAAGLPAPTSFEALLAGAAAFYNLDNAGRPDDQPLVSGIVVPTEDNLPATQQTFEHFAVANGCRLSDSAGEIILLHPACLEALDFYRALVNQYSPPDYQTEITALRAFLAGRTAIIMTTPRVLPLLAGVDPVFPPRCPECADDPAWLIPRTGIATRLAGNPTWGRSANFAELTMIGITTSADTERAQAFVQFLLGDGYLQWLAVEPERKAPLRTGTTPGATDLVEGWRALPMTGGNRPIDTLFPLLNGRPLTDLLLDGLATPSRWGLSEGNPRYAGQIHEALPVSPLLQRMLSGYISSSQAIIDIQRDVSAIAR